MRVIAVVVLLLLVGCVLKTQSIERGETITANVTNETIVRYGAPGDSMRITSTAFQHKGSIPAKYTCQGQDINPPLTFENIPPDAKSLVLIVDDPDAPMGTWDHWVVFNISPHATGIAENSVPEGAIQGLNSWPKNSYGGPCPPSGTHRYFFKLYALDAVLQLSSRVTKMDVERAMKDHLIAEAQIVGTYKKS